MLILKRWFQSNGQKRYLTTLNVELDKAEYYFENGLRKVKPYYYNFHVFAKQRMIGQTVLSTFLKEYRGRSEYYYKYAIEKGLVTINGERVNYDTVLKPQDSIIHKVHRHEPPVTDQPIKIIYEDDGLLVVDKPGGIQVHPSGRYRHNTIVHVMTKELGYNKLYPINRLDRMTSGLMMIAKTSQRAAEIKKELRERTVEKEYVCRVIGLFPRERIVCHAPIKQLSYIVPFNYVHNHGKDCTTVFERLSYNGMTSIVRCKPLSGRTHQIRVHLRYLGYPIANDPIYSYSAAWSHLLPSPHHSLDNSQKIIQSMLDTASYDYMVDPFEETDLPRCQECSVPIIQKDPAPDELSLWLHAVKYTGHSWSYNSPLPAWSDDLFNGDKSKVTASFD